MSDCAGCDDPLPDSNEYAICSQCDSSLHFECADILESTWNRMGQVRRDAWKCKSCSGKGKSRDTTKELIAKLQEEFLVKMEETIKEQFKQYDENLGRQMADFKESVEFFSKKIDEYEKKIDGYSIQVKELKTSQISLEQENRELKKSLNDYKLQLDNLEQYNRNKNIQIDGIPEVTNEKMSDIVKKLENVSDIPIDFSNDIQAIHRLPTRREKGPKPIVIQFTNRQTRDAVLRKCKKLRVKSTDFVVDVPEANVYINAHLTPHNKNLLFYAKKLREYGWSFIWTVEGKVFVKKSESDRKIHVTSIEQIDKLIK